MEVKAAVQMALDYVKEVFEHETLSNLGQQPALVQTVESLRRQGVAEEVISSAIAEVKSA